MKNHSLAAGILLVVLTGCVHTSKQGASGPFNPGADARAQVTNAMVEAREFDKNVLLVFGANWCSDSRATLKLFETNPAIARVLDSSFVVEKIDVGPKGITLNPELVNQYHATVERGIPVLVVLDKSGRLLNDTRVERLADEDHKRPELILEFLEKYSPANEDLR